MISFILKILLNIIIEGIGLIKCYKIMNEYKKIILQNNRILGLMSKCVN